MALDPQAQASLDEAEALALPPAWEIGAPAARERARAAWGAIPRGPEVARVEDRAAPGPTGEIPVRVYWPSEEAGLPIVVWFHGGGWVLGSVEESDPVCRRLAVRSEAIVVSVDYRMAPEDPAPASLEDCHAATVWASEHASELGGDAGRLAVSGASAGGNLAAAVALQARDASGPAIAHQLLVYPVTDSRMDSASYSELATGFGLGREAMRWFWDCYVPEGGAVSREDPLVSPAHASDLSGLPSAQVITAEYDPLRDEGEVYAARLRGSGVEVRATRVAGQLHGFFSRPYVFDAGDQAVTDASEELKRVFAAIARGVAAGA
jgi:acetyl esterase/lipase